MNHDHPAHANEGRRLTLRTLGAAGAISLMSAASRSLVAASAVQCVESREQDEGPYFVDERLNRADIRKDPINGAISNGVPLSIRLIVVTSASGQCAPLIGATVDVWQCDATGRYSDVKDHAFNTLGHKFLRGYQVTDANGLVNFTTIYPGSYPGRSVHIHFKVRGRNAANRSYEFISQLYFDDRLTDRVHAHAPYVGKARRTRNSEDGPFHDGGSGLILPVEPDGAAYTGSFNVVVKHA